jgi:hypothetical protein
MHFKNEDLLSIHASRPSRAASILALKAGAGRVDILIAVERGTYPAENGVKAARGALPTLRVRALASQALPGIPERRLPPLARVAPLDRTGPIIRHPPTASAWRR